MPLTNILKIGGENATEVMARIENVHFALSGGYEVTKSANADEVVSIDLISECNYQLRILKMGLSTWMKSMSLMMKRCLISRTLLLITSIHFGSKDVFLPGLGTLMKGLRIIQTMHR